ncbi:MAG: hypothetical protein H6Q23_323 [Bacteroidetes bacterium]|nr:hypothetical protein [Bacteroidota bacterium]
MNVFRLFRSLAVTTTALLLIQSCLYAQGDGPRAFLLAPKGVWGVNAKWLNLNQNILPANILVPGADISVDVFPITLFHTFSIKGRFSQAYFMFNPGTGTATATSVPPELPIPPGTSLNASGFADGLAGFKLGLIGAPAINVVDFAKSSMQFSLFADARVWYSGSYESSKLFNLGSNRITFQFSAPMAIPLNKNRAKATWLEVAPSIEFFTANSDPSRGNSAEEVKQAPLLIIENHLSRNFTPKLWVVANLRYQYGGETSADGVKDDNTMSILGAGFGGGYQVLPFLGLAADYGTILISGNSAKSDMFRLSIVFSYINMKKAKS